MRLATSFQRETGVVVDGDGAMPRALDRELEVVLLRCAQEALANVRKHAGARHAAHLVVADGEDVVLTVTDDGVGPGDARPGERGFGLAGMRDRAALVGGSFEFGPGARRGRAAARRRAAVLHPRGPRRSPTTPAAPTTSTNPTARPNPTSPMGGAA